MLTGGTQIENATASDLEDLRNRIEAELARRELAARKPPEDRQVVVERPTTTGTLRLEHVKCGKIGARSAPKDPPTGRTGTCTSAATGNSFPST